MTTPGPLDAQVQALVDAVRTEATLEDASTGLAQLRASYSETAERLGGNAMPVGEARDVVAAGVPARLYVPLQCATQPTGLVVYAHGGGWLYGDLPGIERVCRALAAQCGHSVLSVDYRLAPEHPFPAAVQDMTAVVRWAASEEAAAELGHDSARIAVAGDSAGANLAAVAALHHRESVCAQLLTYPALDATLSSDTYATFDQGYMLSRADMASAYEGYLSGADPRDPDVSVLLRADVAGAPPAFIAVASHDVLRGDGERYAAVLQAAGVPVTLRVCEGMVHGFIRWGGAVAATAGVIAAGGEFLASALAA